MFSCQRSFCDQLLVCKKLYYFITVLFVCQELFWFILLFRALLLCNNFYIISFLILSVKNFLTFLSDLISIVLIVLRQQLLYIITSDHLCQEVFLFFSEARSAPMLYFPAALSAMLTILPQMYTVCQQLFVFFSFLLKLILFHRFSCIFTL